MLLGRLDRAQAVVLRAADEGSATTTPFTIPVTAKQPPELVLAQHPGQALAIPGTGHAGDHLAGGPA
jgi:hypothetical protein